MCILCSPLSLHKHTPPSINKQNVSAPAVPLRVLVKAQIFLRRDNAERVRVSHASPPTLHANNGITLAEHSELDGVHDAPLQPAVNVLLPWLRLEVWLRLGEIEWVNAAVQV